MVCGTGSDVGKTHVVTGLCRLLNRRGVRVAPFKAQNMALNSYVTATGHEIGRAQGIQALAARCEPEVAMNPILLKPTGERTSQVVVMGRPTGHMTAADYHARKPDLFGTALAALDDLRSRFDVVVLEGAGSAAEINLLDHDLVNLRLAEAAGVPAVVVGDIDRGGVFASLYGTVALLPHHLRAVVSGFIVNKFRGDPALLGGATGELERRCGVPTLGVVPWLADVALDAEDSLALAGRPPRPAATQPGAPADGLDVAVVRLPRLANFTDFDPLALEPGLGVRFVAGAAALGRPDLVILPGTKATVADLAWLREQGLDRAIAASGADVLGICGGYQMMGHSVADTVESGAGEVAGLGWLDVDTRFDADKITRRRRGTGLNEDVEGYEIRHGRVSGGTGSWIHLDDRYGAQAEGAGSAEDSIRGTSLHGLFENDRFRTAYLAEVAPRRGRTFAASGVSFPAAREAQIDRLADALEESLDLMALDLMIESAAARAPAAATGRVAP